MTEEGTHTHDLVLYSSAVIVKDHSVLVYNASNFRRRFNRGKMETKALLMVRCGYLQPSQFNPLQV